MDVNYMGLLNITKHALPSLRESRGQIVVLSSISGEFGLALRSSYCAAKAAVNMFFRSLRIEEQDIRISLMILDSFTGSNFRNNSLVKASELEDRKKCTVEEVCEMVMNASDRSAEMTLIPGKWALYRPLVQGVETICPSLVTRMSRQKAPPMPKL